MKRINAYLMMVTGSFLVFAAGCITGTHTFSSIGIPTTRYCSMEDRAAPVFDIPSNAVQGASLPANPSVCNDGQTIRLSP